MSGPKTSSVRVVDPMVLKRLAEEREKKAKILFEIKNKKRIFSDFKIKDIDLNIYKKLSQKFNLTKDKFYKNLSVFYNRVNLDREIGELETINKECEKIFGEFKEIYETIFKKIQDEFDKIRKLQFQDEENEILSLIDKISIERKEGAKSIVIDIENIVDRVLKSEARDTTNIKKAEFQEIKLEKRDNSHIFDFSKFSEIQDENDKNVENKLTVKEISEELLENLSNFLELDEYTEKDRQQVLNMSFEILNLKKEDIDLDIKKLLMLEKKEFIEERLKNIKLNNKEVETLYNDYLKEAYLLNLDIKSIRDFTSKDEIENEIKILKEKNKNIFEKKYIKEQLNEVMEKHGYNMIDSEYIEKITTNNRLLYSVDDATGIDVFISDTQEQMLTLKVVGIGFDEEITEKESDRLYEEQCNFCSMFPELVEELRIRGIALEKIKYNEPDKKFNSKIKVKKSSGNRNNKKKYKKNNDKKKYREIER